MRQCQIIPPYLLDRIASSYPDDTAGSASRRTLQIDWRLRAHRATSPPGLERDTDADFSIHTAANGTDLPGELVRTAGDPASGDQAVDEAYVGVEASLALFEEVYGRSSYDGNGAPVIATVHYEQDYDNAFWDGGSWCSATATARCSSASPSRVDVIGHELTHGVTQFTANLDLPRTVRGAQRVGVRRVRVLPQAAARGETAADADWLIGEGIFTPVVKGSALRSMKEPGTAYDDPALGKDPQVATMDDYVETADDNGGVHTNSGIPNKAFYLAATAMGGNAWDGAGKVWYAALTSGLAVDTDFAGFAAATVAAAKAVSAEAEQAVAKAWSDVGVGPASAAVPAPGSTGSSAASGLVAVTRSGGVAGVRQSGELRMGDDPRTPEVESLIGRIDFASVPASTPQPDRFVYTFHVWGQEVVVGEPDLTPDLQQLARLVLPG